MNDGSGFKNVVRMTPTDFEVLIQMIGPNICKQDTKYRAAIPVSLRLAITLRYLASGVIHILVWCTHFEFQSSQYQK